MVKGGYNDGRKDLLKMDYLPSGAIIRNNDQVVTSGSTVYPRNLIMGHIVDAGFDETGVAKYAIIEPSADMGRLEQLFVITDYTAEVTGGKKTETAYDCRSKQSYCKMLDFLRLEHAGGEGLCAECVISVNLFSIIEIIAPGVACQMEKNHADKSPDSV
jgi:hypothetical protein